MDSRKAPHVNGLSIVGGWGDASGQGGDVTEGSDFNLVFVGCPLNVSTHTADQTAEMQENRENLEIQGSILACGMWPMFISPGAEARGTLVS